MTKTIFSDDELKERIVKVALKQFLAQGIRNLTMMKLVEPLGVSTKTVYKYFRSKEELLAECLKVLYADYYNEIDKIVKQADNPLNTLHLLFRRTLEKDFGISRDFFHDLNYYYPELQNSAIRHNAENYTALMVPLIERGIQEGYLSKDLDPDLALKGIVSLYTIITRSEEYRNYIGSPYYLFKNLVEVYIKGMCTPQGLIELYNNPNYDQQ